MLINEGLENYYAYSGCGHPGSTNPFENRKKEYGVPTRRSSIARGSIIILK